MTGSGRLCDGADWFDPEFARIVREELEEEPRFHRKQWEFARIFRALDARGLLGLATRGLSMGGGTERLLYAIARRAGHLTVTDLYGAASDWACARTGDPHAHVMRLAPFPIDESRLTVRRMDMRMLEFPDQSFDFCYSSCAIEHIGGHDDFVRHLREVRRVLRDQGVYVLTTEFHYGPDVLPYPNNYYFSAAALGELVAEGGFACAGEVDARVARHAVNHPLPAAVGDLLPQDDFARDLLGSLAHVQLLAGRHPFTSICLVLTKAAVGLAPGPLDLPGLTDARAFMEEGVARWRRMVERSRIRLDSFAAVGSPEARSEVPRRVAAPGSGGPPGTGDTLFHTGYVWLGSARLVVSVDFESWRADAEGEPSIELRVHRHPTDNPTAVECTYRTTVRITRRGGLRERFELSAEEGWCYAVLAKVASGACWVGRGDVSVGPD